MRTNMPSILSSRYARTISQNLLRHCQPAVKVVVGKKFEAKVLHVEAKNVFEKHFNNVIGLLQIMHCENSLKATVKFHDYKEC